MVRIFMIFSLAGLAIAQTSRPAVENSYAESTSAVAPGEAVLTIHGICSLPPNPLSIRGQNCTVLVRRQEFENLLKIVSPNGQVTPTLKRSLAKTYAGLMAFETAALKSGMVTSLPFQETLEWSRLRTLAELYRQALEKDLSVASEQEVDDYYRQHMAQFEEVKLRRMLVPKTNFAATDKQAWEKKALEVATEFRERAARGEDLDQLQKEAYIAAGFNSLPPSTEVGTRRRSDLTPDVSEDVFALRPGEVSKVEKEAYSFVIYKVNSKRTLPREAVREEISRQIIKGRIDAALQSITDSVHADLNENYFGAPAEQ